MDDGERVRQRWEVVLPHRQYLVRIAVRRGLSAQDAEDCAQEAMVRCVGFADLDEQRVLEFLATTTMRLCVDQHRLRQRDVRVSAKLTSWFVDEPSPEDATCDRGEATWVASHVAALPASQRAALAARAEGLTCHEIAARMNLSYKAVESLLSRARAYVRAAVATGWVLLARLRRRGLDVPDGVPAMALVVLVGAAVLPPGGPGRAPAGTTARPAQGVAAPVVARPAAVVAAVPRPAAVAAPAFSPVPVAPRPSPPASLPPYGPPLPPLPTAVPTDPCDLRLPHTETCIPLEDYEPGEGLRNCVRYGAEISTSSGFACRTS